jgi:glycosyltransferase involved in cell wall biosynthesis
MNYLLVNHVPFGRGSTPKTFRVGDMWLQDLRAQNRAIGAHGRMIVATPLVDHLDSGLSGSFNLVEIDPADEGFDYFPLPFFISMKQYIAVRRELKTRLAETITKADVVQLGYGGHPVAVGQVAWPIAGRLGKKRIWVFDGADPFPRMQLHADSEKNPVKRWAKRVSVRRFENFCRTAIRDADLVFTHNAAVAQRFKPEWNGRCHAFDRSFVTRDILLMDSELKSRQTSLLDSGKPLRLIAAGRQIAIKGTDQVLKAMARAIKAGAKLELDVIGDGEDLESFKTLAGDLGLGDVVRFRGKLPYGQVLFDAWSDSQVMVITNLTAEISRNVLLAMARGLPLIMYRNPGTDDLIEKNNAGVLVPTGDVDALASSLEQAWRDRAKLADLAARGLDVAQRQTLDATHDQRASLAANLIPSPLGGEREKHETAHRHRQLQNTRSHDRVSAVAARRGGAAPRKQGHRDRQCLRR